MLLPNPSPSFLLPHSTPNFRLTTRSFWTPPYRSVHSLSGTEKGSY